MPLFLAQVFPRPVEKYSMKTHGRTLNKYVVASAVTSLLLSAGCAKVEFAPVETNGSLASQTPDQTSGLNPKVVKTTEVVAYGNKQVDFLLVLDDSTSMMPELQKLAARMETFVNSLDDSDIDWQMCLVTTRGVNINGNVVFGSLENWSRYSPGAGRSAKVLKKGTGDLNMIFNTTIANLPIGNGLSGDERGIKAAHSNFVNAASHSCYRPGAAVSVILISDEDERSVGGNASKVKEKDSKGTYQPLEKEDLPSTFIEQAKATFGHDVRLTFSSIIVKPGDTDCEKAQDLNSNSPSHEGYIYEMLSNLTDGGVGSVCDDDYSGSLNNFRNKIVNSLSSMTLECAPVKKSVKVKVAGVENKTFKVDGNILKFSSPLIEGTLVDLEYECLP